MKNRCALGLATLLLIQLGTVRSAPARDLDWKPEKTWLFVVGVLSWKNSDMFGSFPVKNRAMSPLSISSNRMAFLIPGSFTSRTGKPPRTGSTALSRSS